MVNEKYHGEIYSSNLTSYSYMICELLEGKFYDVQVLVINEQINLSLKIFY